MELGIASFGAFKKKLHDEIVNNIIKKISKVVPSDGGS